jgi:hypothetical protein
MWIGYEEIQISRKKKSTLTENEPWLTIIIIIRIRSK